MGSRPAANASALAASACRPNEPAAVRFVGLPRLAPPAGARPVSRPGGRIVAIEGAVPKRVGINEWDSLEQAQAFYNSKAYKDLAPHRDKAVKTIRRYIVEAGN